MNLQRREKILATIFGVLALLLAAWFLLLAGDSRSTSQLEAARQRLTAEVDKKEARIHTATLLARRLADWERRALPSDLAHARSLYQSWLRQLANKSQFHQLKVDSSGGQPRHDKSAVLTFTLNGRIALPQLVTFLHEFYTAGHLHQIRRMDLKPAANSPELEVSMTVEAMSLPRADRKSELTKLPGKVLQSAKLPDYIGSIVSRNFFGPASPPPPSPEQNTFVTAIVATGGQGEVWLLDKSSKMTRKFHAGERIEIGSFKATVKTIGDRDAVLDLGDRLSRYRCGDCLRGGEPIPDPTKPSPPPMPGPPHGRPHGGRPAMPPQQQPPGPPPGTARPPTAASPSSAPARQPRSGS